MDIQIIEGRVKFAHVYTPFRRAPGEKTFSLILQEPKIDPALLHYVTFDEDDANVIKLFSKLRPMIVPRKESRLDLKTLLQCADDSNLNRDELFIGTMVRVAVEPIQYETQRPGSFTRPSGSRKVRRLALSGIEADPDAMTTRYDDLCREKFGRSWPEMILRRQRGEPHVQAVCDKVTAWLNDVNINSPEYQLRRQAVGEMSANLGFSKVKEAAEAGHGNEYLELMERWDR